MTGIPPDYQPWHDNLGLSVGKKSTEAVRHSMTRSSGVGALSGICLMAVRESLFRCGLCAVALDPQTDNPGRVDASCTIREARHAAPTYKQEETYGSTAATALLRRGDGAARRRDIRAEHTRSSRSREPRKSCRHRHRDGRSCIRRKPLLPPQPAFVRSTPKRKSGLCGSVIGRCTAWCASGAQRRMITGTINADREATIRLMVRGPGGQEQEIEAVIDTGFNGFLTLPPTVVTTLGLPRLGRGRAILANGSQDLFDVYEVTVLWGRTAARRGNRRRRHGCSDWHGSALWTRATSSRGRRRYCRHCKAALTPKPERL